MTVQMLVKTIWFAVLLYLFASLVFEDVLPLMAECSWIYSLSLILPDFYVDNPRGRFLQFYFSNTQV